MTPRHPLSCYFDGDVILLLSPLIQRCSLKTLWEASAFVDTGVGHDGVELSGSSSLYSGLLWETKTKQTKWQGS